MDITSAITVFGWALIIVLFFLFLIFMRLGKSKDQPPGPVGLPIVGFLPFLSSRPYETFRNLSKRHGDILGIRLGQRNVIVLNSYSAIKEAFVKNADVFSGRYSEFSTMGLIHNKASIVVTQGGVWQLQRRFALNVLRDFGLGKLSLERVIQREAQSVVKSIDETSSQGSAVRVMPFLTAATYNVISSITFRRRFSSDEPEFKELIHFLNIAASRVGAVEVLNFLPWLRHLPIVGRNYAELCQVKENLYSFFDNVIRTHETERAEAGYDRDYVDSYLREAEENPLFTKYRLRANMFLFFAAGTSTTSGTLHWGLNILAGYEDVQKKLHEELDRELGPPKGPFQSDETGMASWSDRYRFPWTEAVLLEVHRIASIAPLSIPHAATEDCYIGGYLIPKGKMVIPNLWAVHNDPKLWGDDVDKFNPQRFLDERGKVVNPEYLIPFSIGKRACMGISLAKMELFVAFSHIVHNFRVSLPPSGEKQTFAVSRGLRRDLNDVPLAFTPRYPSPGTSH